MQIKNTQQLRKAIAEGQNNFRLLLQGGLYSAKTISVLADGRFRVENHIDETVQRLSGRQLYTLSNIGEGMRRGAFITVPASDNIDRKYTAFPIASVCRADLEEEGFDTETVDDDAMRTLAGRLGKECGEYDEQLGLLEIIAEQLGIPRRAD